MVDDAIKLRDRRRLARSSLPSRFAGDAKSIKSIKHKERAEHPRRHGCGTTVALLETEN
jgi:hypothetical protein